MKIDLYNKNTGFRMPISQQQIPPHPNNTTQKDAFMTYFGSSTDNPSTTIGVTDFIKGRNPEGPGSFFDGTWEELRAIVESNWKLAVQSDHGDGRARILPVPTELLNQFKPTVIQLEEGMQMAGEFKPRRPGEAPIKELYAVLDKQAKAGSAQVILYDQQSVREDDEAMGKTRINYDADYYIVSVKVQGEGVESNQPIDPITIIRNWAGEKYDLPGGSLHGETIDYEKAFDELARSVLWHDNHAQPKVR